MNEMLAAIDLSAPTQIAPAWLIVPLAGITLILIWAHVASLSRTEMPDSRRRIRSANGLLLLLLPPLMTYALTMVSPRQPTEFVLAWCAVAALLMLIVFLAVLDAVNTLRLHRRALRQLRVEAVELRRSLMGRTRPDAPESVTLPADARVSRTS